MVKPRSELPCAQCFFGTSSNFLIKYHFITIMIRVVGALLFMLSAVMVPGYDAVLTESEFVPGTHLDRAAQPAASPAACSKEITKHKIKACFQSVKEAKNCLFHPSKTESRKHMMIVEMCKCIVEVPDVSHACRTTPMPPAARCVWGGLKGHLHLHVSVKVRIKACMSSS